MYISDIRETEKLWDLIYPDLPETRKEKIRRLKAREEQLRSAAAGFLIRRILGIDEDRDIITNEFGKPLVREGALPPARSFFSLTHGGNYAALEVGGISTGIDTEEILEFPGSIFRRCFLEDEKEWVLRGDYNERCYAVWTMKESIMKADGHGISMDPKSFSVFSGEWNTWYRIHDGHMFACASKGEVKEELMQISP